MTAVNISLVRDTRWLTLGVCKEFQRGTSSRPDADCKSASTPRVCHVENARVVACFDSLKTATIWQCVLFWFVKYHEFPKKSYYINETDIKNAKGRCTRDNCKYLHPPPQLKARLEINGRNNLIQQKTAATMFAQQMQLMLQNAQMSSLASFPMNPALPANPPMAFGPYLHHPGMNLIPAELLPNTPVLVPGNPPLALPGVAGPKLMRSDKLEVCREFQRGNCTRGESDCRYAHPTDVSMIEVSDNTVTICMDYIKGRCCREKCKYFHPPAHLQAKLKAAHHQMNHSAAAAMALHPGALQLIPKRGALEKTNGITPVYSPSVFHCQQPLANLPLAQPIPQGLPQPIPQGLPQALPQPAFIPAGPILCMAPTPSIVSMMHGATPTTVSAATTPATSVPFAPTATGNQSRY